MNQTILYEKDDSVLQFPMYQAQRFVMFLLQSRDKVNYYSLHKIIDNLFTFANEPKYFVRLSSFHRAKMSLLERPISKNLVGVHVAYPFSQVHNAILKQIPAILTLKYSYIIDYDRPSVLQKIFMEF